MTNQNRPLVRDTHNRVIGGVCSGVANYFGWDITAVRVVSAVSVLFFGAPILIYLVMWIVIPADNSVYEARVNTEDTAYQAGYQVGYQEGWRQGYEAAASGR